MRSLALPLRVLGPLLAAWSLAACAGAPGEATTLTVKASAATAPVGAPVTITANVLRSDGSPVAVGTIVTFTAAGGTLSDLTGTDAAGTATAILTSAARGAVTVTARVGALPPQTETVTFVDPNAPYQVGVAAPAVASLGAEVVLTATVVPAGANGTGGPGGAIPDGTVVSFTSSAGALSAVTTTTGGRATATLGGVGAPGEVVVSASVAGVTSLPATISFMDPDVPGSLTLAGAPAAGLIGGQRPVTVTARVLRVAGGPVPAGTPVAFALTSGPGSLSATGALTDASGLASVVVNGSAEGSLSVQASAGAASATLEVPFTDPSKPLAVALFAAPGTGVAGGQGPVTLTAVVSPAEAGVGRIADGTAVTFAVVGGAGALSASTAPTTDGVASVTLDGPLAGVVSVVARAGAAPLVTSNTVAVTFIAQPTVAIVTLGTTGALPPGAAIGGIHAIVTAPSTGLSIAEGDHLATGAGEGSMLVANPADPGADVLALINAFGLGPGEFATLTYHVAPGTFPRASDFGAALAGQGVIDLAGERLSGMGVEVLAVSIR